VDGSFGALGLSVDGGSALPITEGSPLSAEDVASAARALIVAAIAIDRANATQIKKIAVLANLPVLVLSLMILRYKSHSMRFVLLAPLFEQIQTLQR